MAAKKFSIALIRAKKIYTLSVDGFLARFLSYFSLYLSAPTVMTAVSL